MGNHIGHHIGKKSVPNTDKHPITDCRLPITDKLPHVFQGEAGITAAAPS